MRDDSHKWAPAEAVSFTLQGADISVKPVFPSRQTLVSGPAVLNDIAREFGTPAGWPDPARGDSYAVALRRDRVLVVNGPDRAEGWDAARAQAVSDITGGLAVFEMQGAGLMALLSRGTEIAPDAPSRSAARLFGGFEVVLYCHSAPGRARLHVARAEAAALAQTLARLVRRMG